MLWASEAEKREHDEKEISDEWETWYQSLPLVADREETEMSQAADYLKLDQLEALYMDGAQDDVSGDVEAPTGHFYRVCRQIVTTDSQGFKEVESFGTENEAKAAFEIKLNEYDEWAGEDD